MAVVEPQSVDETSEETRELLAAIEEKYGKVLNIFGTMAHQPKILKGIVDVNEGLQSDLPAKFRELAYYKASRVNDCEYCSHYHRQAAEKAGVTSEQLDQIDDFQDSLLFDDEEKAVLTFAEQLTENADVEGWVRDRLKSFFDEAQLVTLASSVALANFTNRFNHALDVDLP